MLYRTLIEVTQVANAMLLNRKLRYYLPCYFSSYFGEHYDVVTMRLINKNRIAIWQHDEKHPFTGFTESDQFVANLRLSTLTL